MSDSTDAPVRPLADFPLLAWLLAVLALAHAGGVLADVLPGGNLPAAGVDAALAAVLAAVALLGRARLAERLVQRAAAVTLVAAGLGSGARAALAGQPWWGADIVLVVLVAAVLTDRWDAAVTTTTALFGWTVAAIVGVLGHTASSRPPAVAWMLVAVLIGAAGLVGAGARLTLAITRQQYRAVAGEAARHAVSDPLTGASNRRGLELFALPMIEHARRQGEAVHCLFIDLDEFRTVNERLGRGEGDQVLSAVCEALLASVRATDVLARWAGDQFVVVGPGTGTSPLEMERRVRGQLTAQPPVPSEIWPARVSIGSATLVPWDDGNLDSLLRRAEEDMQLRRSLRRQSRDRDRDRDRSSILGPAPAPAPAPAPDVARSGEDRPKPPTTPPPPSPSVPNDL